MMQPGVCETVKRSRARPVQPQWEDVSLSVIRAFFYFFFFNLLSNIAKVGNWGRVMKSSGHCGAVVGDSDGVTLFGAGAGCGSVIKFRVGQCRVENLAVRVDRSWHSLPREVVDVPWKRSRSWTRLGVTWAGERCPCARQGMEGEGL